MHESSACQDALWSRYDVQAVSSIRGFCRDPKTAWEFERDFVAMCKDVRPNPAHFAIASLAHGGLLQHVVTQNCDGLHSAAFETTETKSPFSRPLARLF